MAHLPMFFERSNGAKGATCNQFECPVNCVKSQCSSFFLGSKMCGVTRGKTRSIMTQSKNEESECDSTLDEERCYTGSRTAIAHCSFGRLGGFVTRRVVPACKSDPQC